MNEPTSCESFEIASLMRLLNALPANAGASLAAHLNTCARCREFESRVTSTEVAMRNASLGIVQRRDLDAIRTRLQRRIALSKRKFVRGILALATMIAVDWWAWGSGFGFPAAVVTAVVVVLIAITLILPKHRRALRVASSETAFLEF